MADLLAEYDAHLRTSAEVQGAVDVQRRGPVWIALFSGGRLFVAYDELDVPAARVAEVAALISGDDSIQHAEWKTRTHDHAPGLQAALGSAAISSAPAEYTGLPARLSPESGAAPRYPSIEAAASTAP